MVSKMRLKRIERELSQVDLWQITDIPQWRVSLIERGITPTLEEKEKICVALGCQASTIFPVYR